VEAATAAASIPSDEPEAAMESPLAAEAAAAPDASEPGSHSTEETSSDVDEPEAEAPKARPAAKPLPPPLAPPASPLPSRPAPVVVRAVPRPTPPAPQSDAPARKLYFWKLRQRELRLGERTLLMGILNVTPDSFSDGGKYSDADRAYARAIELEELGADIIDIGAESTRPGSSRVTADEELRRLVPVLKRLKDKLTHGKVAF